ncbi:MAG: hypothetical protein D6762_03495 [Candidatus Neomarinimicrobiota bacterium]|nr:MAG: hypothetical protein D6762_03495 [Candidatus Neomarinimicrobiota bacterium]
MTARPNPYDHLFTHVKPHAVGNIRIFTRKDPYRIEQNVTGITAEENRIWGRLMDRVVPGLDTYACPEYRRGFRQLPIPRDRFPVFAELNRVLQPATGWSLTPVAGFLDEDVFFSLNARREFPVTDIIRRSARFREKYAGISIENEDGYTPEPDIFHDVVGHTPFLMDPDYTSFLEDMGQLGRELLEDEHRLGPDLVAHNLKRLQNFAWWTYEFGLLKKSPAASPRNDCEHEIYGAGILSSFAETQHVVDCSRGRCTTSELRPFNLEEIVLTRFDYSTVQDRYYVIESFDQLYTEYYRHRDLFRFQG